MMQTKTRRMVWRCRRGLLELDIVLGNFVTHYFETLTAKQLTTFERLLDYPDNELWDLVTARVETDDTGARTLLQAIRNMEKVAEK